jgi:hypothetical protein
MKVNHNIIFKYYQLGIYENVEKIYAIGDIHGDLNAFIYVLQKANLIDNNLNWCGGNSHVVQVGDILDRKVRDVEYTDEDSEFKIISLILNLQLESFVAGGGFHPIIGNHEIMNILGIFDYVSPMGMRHFKSVAERREYFRIGNDFCKYLACSWNPIIKINEFIFCHGGIDSNIASKYSINNINYIMRDTLYGNGYHLNKTYFTELFLNENSILWNRLYSTELQKNKIEYAKKSLNKMLNIYNAKYLVVGHTPQENGINTKFNGKVICVDTGMSESFGKKSNIYERIHYLEILSKTNEIIIH